MSGFGELLVKIIPWIIPICLGVSFIMNHDITPPGQKKSKPDDKSSSSSSDQNDSTGK